MDDCMYYLAMLLHSLQVGEINDLQAAVSFVPSNECFVIIMLAWVQEVLMMTGGMREVLTDMVRLMKLEKSCCLAIYK